MATRAQIEASLSANFAAWQIDATPGQPASGNQWSGSDVLFYRVRALETQGSRFRLVDLWVANIGTQWYASSNPLAESARESALKTWAGDAARGWTVCALSYQNDYQTAQATVIEGGLVKHLIIYPSGASFASAEIPEILQRF